MSTPQPKPPVPPAPPGPGPMIPVASQVALLTRDEFSRVALTVAGNNPGMETDLAGRIVGEALAYLVTVSRNRDLPLAPSPVVDEGWHALILHTEMYGRLCEKLGGFIHHYPQTPDETAYDAGTIRLTLATMAESGVGVDPQLWAGPDANEVSVRSVVWHAPDCSPIKIIKKPKPKPQPSGNASKAA
ncbi:hypothetical protein [Kitasatospora sp. NPDC093558]|uniref:glycine-rich domain-containing protein n=1 Tax=Kitasatospora sp. NPDC093558 TaxID=3155201 RepID=UPI00341A1FF3